MRRPNPSRKPARRRALPLGCWLWAVGCTPLPAGPAEPTAAPSPTSAAPLGAAPAPEVASAVSVANGPAVPGPSAELVDDGEPVYTPEIQAARAAARARLLPGSPSGEPGKFLPIENEAALEHFHRALEQLAAGQDADGKVRITAYGASHTQAGYYTSYLRHYLQQRFGNGGQGFLPAARINDYYRDPDYHVWSRGGQAEYVKPGEYPKHGRFGLMGVAIVAESNEDFGRVLPRNNKETALQADRFELFYAAEPGGGDLFFSVNWKPVRLPTDAAHPEPRYHTIETPELGWHQAQVAPVGGDEEGPIRVFGIAVERSTPGVVVDTLGINGARAAYALKWDQALWREHLERRQPDLYTLAFGTNEAVDVREPIETYEKNLRRVLGRFRQAVPEASCLLIGPGDFPEKRRGAWQTRARLLKVIAVQRRLAPEFACGFWDTFEFMGGEGSMVEWVAAKPPLAASDHIHFTPHGYVEMGMALGDALMRRYDAQRVDPASATVWGY